MNDAVMVRARRTFEGSEGFKSPASPPFEVSRLRAAELRANGLVEVVGGQPEPPPAVPNPTNAAGPHKGRSVRRT